MLRFIFALHNHQPIGNFSGVMEQAYRESYLPFLDVFEPFTSLKLTLHTSGSLIDFLADAHPEYLDRLAKLVANGRIEIVGGPFFEPILAMLPSRDRVGQITSYTAWLRERLGARVEGMWVPERVWEQSYVRDLVAAGMRYAILDDAHFRNAGVASDQLFRHYVTEDDGETMYVFPGSERLRYLIPFGKIRDTINYLREYYEKFSAQGSNGGAVIVHGDDGEKFGSWPDTARHVFDDQWLQQFFTALTENESWLKTTTPQEVLQNVSPLGKIYLPDGSYREMTEWVLPPELRHELNDLTKIFRDDPRWTRLQQFIRGGFWRNFKVRYGETDEMYCRMLAASTHLQSLQQRGIGERDENAKTLIESARRALYRGQCNCSYWHGAFGGVYLPHLRNAVYQELITADALLDRAEGKTSPFVEAVAGEFLLDGEPCVRLRNETLDAWISPHRGGMLYELDVKPIAHNLLATLTRREEEYHQKLRGGETLNEYGKPLCKTDGLAQLLQYDSYRRLGFIDLFYDSETSLDSVRFGTAGQHGDFVDGRYDAVIRKNPDKIQIVLSRNGFAYGVPVRLTKGITLSANSDTLAVAYQLEGIPSDYRFHFATEMNFAGLPAGLEDRYFYALNGEKSFEKPLEKLGHLGTPLDISYANGIALRDEWLKLDVQWTCSRPTCFYAFPIEAISKSEGGVERIHQSVAIVPHWWIIPDAHGTWGIEFFIKMSRVE